MYAIRSYYEEAGFHLERRQHAEEEIIYTDANAFLKAIHSYNFV